MCTGSEVLCELLQWFCCAAEGFERGEGILDQGLCVAAGLLDAEHGGPGGLYAGGILTGGLAEFLG